MIYIEANSGAVKRVGRSDAHATEFDLEAEEYVPLPKVSLSILSCRSQIDAMKVHSHDFFHVNQLLHSLSV